MDGWWRRRTHVVGGNGDRCSVRKYPVASHRRFDIIEINSQIPDEIGLFDAFGGAGACER